MEGSEDGILEAEGFTNGGSCHLSESEALLFGGIFEFDWIVAINGHNFLLSQLQEAWQGK